MGGSASEEFLATAENGEDTYVRCTTCDYAANVEAVQVRPTAPIPFDGLPAAHVEDTPDTPTIDTLVDAPERGVPARPTGRGMPRTRSRTSSSCSRTPTVDASRSPIGIPGDREVDEKRLQAQVEPAELTAFTEADFAANPALAQGVHRAGCARGSTNASGIRFLVDPRVVDGTAWVTGADEDGRHVLDLVAGRDFVADGVIEAAEVRAGDLCPRDGGALETARGIEMGHIFQLGRRFAEALDLQACSTRTASSSR